MAKFSGIGSNVKTLMKKDFDNNYKIKSTKKSGMVVFFATWCGYCEMLVPEYKKLSKKTGINVYAIDVDKNPEVTRFFQVQGFPTIRYVNSKGEIDSKTYMGERTANEMIKYIKSRGMKGGGIIKKIKKRVVCKGKECKKVKCKCKKVMKCKGKSCKGKCEKKCNKKVVKKVVKKNPVKKVPLKKKPTRKSPPTKKVIKQLKRTLKKNKL